MHLSGILTNKFGTSTMTKIGVNFQHIIIVVEIETSKVPSGYQEFCRKINLWHNSTTL